MKLLVVGLDGATFTTLDHWVSQGWMPHLKALMKRGRQAVLYSTLPPSTAPGWVSCMSGVNPGRHGIYNFIKGERLGETALHTSSDISVSRLWHLLENKGYSAHVLDVPLTWPAEAIRGVMVSDLMVAGSSGANVSPPHVRQELERALHTRFQWSMADGLEVSERYLRHLERKVDEKWRVDEWIFKRYPVDALVTVYQHSDVLQHYFWHVWDSAHPLHTRALARRLEPGIQRVVRSLDQAVGGLCLLAGEEATVALVSDHGFGRAALRVMVNEHLLAEGDLLLKAEPVRKRAASRSLAALKTILAGPLDRLGLRAYLSLSGFRRIKQVLMQLEPEVDYVRSRAWLSHSLAPGLTLSDEARKDSTYVQQLMARLRGWESPLGSKVFDHVLTRESVYHGPALDRAPDVLLQASPGHVVMAELGSGQEFLPPRAGEVTGFHRPEGVFLLAGPRISASPVREIAEIVDVVPTLLTALELPCPPLDGVSRFLLEHSAAAEWGREIEGRVGQETPLTEEEEKAILARLQSLGYA